MKRSPLLLCLAALTLPSPLRAGTELDPLRRPAIQDGGRFKPFDTFARELSHRVSPHAFGVQSVKGLDPVEWLVAMSADGEHWRNEPIIRVTHAGLREAAGLPATKDHYSWNELAQDKGF